MAINVSLQCNGRFLPDMMLLTLCYYHRGTLLNAMERSFVFAAYVCMYGRIYSKSMDQPGKVANPARGQLNMENEQSTVVPVRACEIGLARRVWLSRPASACSSPYSG